MLEYTEYFVEVEEVKESSLVAQRRHLHIGHLENEQWLVREVEVEVNDSNSVSERVNAISHIVEEARQEGKVIVYFNQPEWYALFCAIQCFNEDDSAESRLIAQNQGLADQVLGIKAAAERIIVKKSSNDFKTRAFKVFLGGRRRAQDRP